MCWSRPRIRAVPGVFRIILGLAGPLGWACRESNASTLPASALCQSVP